MVFLLPKPTSVRNENNFVFYFNIKHLLLDFSKLKAVVESSFYQEGPVFFIVILYGQVTYHFSKLMKLLSKL